MYILLHLECHSNSISNLNLLGLFSTKRGKRDLQNEIINWDLRMKKWHFKCNRLYSLFRMNWHFKCNRLYSLFRIYWLFSRWPRSVALVDWRGHCYPLYVSILLYVVFVWIVLYVLIVLQATSERRFTWLKRALSRSILVDSFVWYVCMNCSVYIDCSAGDLGASLYLIEKGAVTLALPGGGVLKTVAQGCFFGDHAFVANCATGLCCVAA